MVKEHNSGSGYEKEYHPEKNGGYKLFAESVCNGAYGFFA